jgi:hypothetical protein
VFEADALKARRVDDKIGIGGVCLKQKNGFNFLIARLDVLINHAAIQQKNLNLLGAIRKYLDINM